MFQSTARWQINSYTVQCISGGVTEDLVWFQSTARWQINSYLGEGYFIVNRHSGICFNRRHAGRSILTYYFNTRIQPHWNCFNRRHAGRSILTYYFNTRIQPHWNCFNRRHAGRSILTFSKRVKNLNAIRRVSIDGTLADQFLPYKKDTTALKLEPEFQSTARWQINSYLGEGYFIVNRHSGICFNRRHAGRSILT